MGAASYLFWRSLDQNTVFFDIGVRNALCEIEQFKQKSDGFAGEHFSFDLTCVRTRLGWVPEKSIQRDLNGILIRAVRERTNWLKINSLRPR